jgi:hypothetical protein
MYKDVDGPLASLGIYIRNLLIFMPKVILKKDLNHLYTLIPFRAVGKVRGGNNIIVKKKKT